MCMFALKKKAERNGIGRWYLVPLFIYWYTFWIHNKKTAQFPSQNAKWSLLHTKETCWANRLAWWPAQLCIFTAHVGKLLNNNIIDKIVCIFPHFVQSRMKKLRTVSHWLIDSSSSALSSQHPPTLRFFPREVKNIIHDRYFPREVKSSWKLSAPERNLLS
jgi:hypothetical protein